MMESGQSDQLSQRFKQQIGFIVEIDKIKHILRKAKLFDGSRCENDAEHSWHLAMMALLLGEYAQAQVDILKVLKMVLIHDLAEIDSGDTIVYDELRRAANQEHEAHAARRIFGLLPPDQAQEFVALWHEFEARVTPEAKFAASLDRLEPIMQNYYTHGQAWRAHQVSEATVLRVNEYIGAGSRYLWQYAQRLIAETFQGG